MRSFDRAPRFAFSRLLLADDPATPVGEDHGWNFEGYQNALFQLIPVQNPLTSEAAYKTSTDVSGQVGTPTSNPAVEVFFWNAQAKLWLKDIPALTYAAAGAGIPVQIDVPVLGRRATLKITGVIGGQGVLVYTAAYDFTTME